MGRSFCTKRISTPLLYKAQKRFIFPEIIASLIAANPYVNVNDIFVHYRPIFSKPSCILHRRACSFAVFAQLAAVAEFVRIRSFEYREFSGIPLLGRTMRIGSF